MESEGVESEGVESEGVESEGVEGNLYSALTRWKVRSLRMKLDVEWYIYIV